MSKKEQLTENLLLIGKLYKTWFIYVSIRGRGESPGFLLRDKRVSYPDSQEGWDVAHFFSLHHWGGVCSLLLLLGE